MATNPNIGPRREVRRADEITSGTTIASAGRLVPEQEDRFISQGVDQVVALKKVTPYLMESDQHYLETFALASRIIRKPGEITAAANTTITPSKRSMLVEEIVVTYSPSYQFFEDNLEREGGEQSLMDEFSIQFFNDMEDLAFNGDGTTPGFLACNKGWPTLIKAASSTHKVDIDAAVYAVGDFDTVIFQAIFDALPAKFRARKADFELWVSVNDSEKWLKQVRNRGTPLGDTVYTEGKLPMWNGVKVVPMAYLTDNTYMLSRPKNLAYGIRRGITAEVDRQPKQRLVEVTISARVDFEFALEDEIVYGYDIP